jgi:polysaccharide export outer membrane protein
MKIVLNGFLLVSALALPCLGQVTARPVLSATPPPQAAPAARTGAAPGGAGATGTLEAPKNNSMALSPEYRIGPYDLLQVTVWKEQQLSGSFPVRPDGKISLVLLGDVAAAGTTPMELSATLTDMLKKYIQDPLVTVTVTAVNSQKIYVVGQVGHIGAVDLSPGMTPLEAIAAAGGLNPFSSGKHAYILRGEPGKQAKIFFDYKKALKGEPNQAILLQTGDTVVIP